MVFLPVHIIFNSKALNELSANRGPVLRFSVKIADGGLEQDDGKNNRSPVYLVSIWSFRNNQICENVESWLRHSTSLMASQNPNSGIGFSISLASHRKNLPCGRGKFNN